MNPIEPNISGLLEISEVLKRPHFQPPEVAELPSSRQEGKTSLKRAENQLGGMRTRSVDFHIMAFKVFFPLCCASAESGLLIGRWIPEQNSVVILAVIHFPLIPGQVKQYLSKMQHATQVQLSVLGSWTNSQEKQTLQRFMEDLGTIFSQGPWIQLSRQKDSKFWNCLATWKESSGGSGSEEIIVVYYDQRKVMLSELHPPHNHGVPSGQKAADASKLAAVFDTVAKSQVLFMKDRYDEGPIRLTHWQSEGVEASIIVELMKQVSVPACALITLLLSFVAGCCQSR